MKPSVLEANPELESIIFDFLSMKDYSSEKGALSKKVIFVLSKYALCTFAVCKKSATFVSSFSRFLKKPYAYFRLVQFLLCLPKKTKTVIQ